MSSWQLICLQIRVNSGGDALLAQNWDWTQGIWLEERGAAHVFKLNVDDSPAVMDRYGIQAIPTLILFQDGVEKIEIDADISAVANHSARSSSHCFPTRQRSNYNVS